MLLDLWGVKASVVFCDTVGCNGEGVSIGSWHEHAQQIACCTLKKPTRNRSAVTVLIFTFWSKAK